MKDFKKITVGFVVQDYKKDNTGHFVCTDQNFVAGDQVDYEDNQGNKINPPRHDYQPYKMLFTNKMEMLVDQLSEACKSITSYTTDLLYKLDDQMDVNDVQEIRQAKDAIGKYENTAPRLDELLIESFISEQCSDFPDKKLLINLMVESGKLWIGPTSYGDKCSIDGHGFPVALEIWQGKLRLIVFDDINTEDPKIIDLENARENTVIKCNWYKKELGSQSVKWNDILFCSNSCLDACRAAQ